MSTKEFRQGRAVLVIPVEVDEIGTVAFHATEGGGYGAGSGIIRRAGGEVLYHAESPANLARKLRDLADQIEANGLPLSARDRARAH